MTEVDKIIQIMPAEGWYAKFRDEDGEENYALVVCFAIVETEEEGHLYRSVRPMYSSPEGMIDFADEADSFAGLSHASEDAKE